MIISFYANCLYWEIQMKNGILNIAIDGPSGSGKSTLADRIAAEYGLIHIDTGALYRAVGLFMRDSGVASTDAAGVIAMLPQADVTMRLESGKGHVFLNGKKLGQEIRTPEISKYASDVSAIPEVREFLLETQRSIARTNGVVMDGRDIGTVILPDADVKIFLVASDEVRAARRVNELAAKGTVITLEEALEAMRTRDSNDKNRKASPAIPADDAVMLDNSSLDLDGTFDAAKSIIDRAIS